MQTINPIYFEDKLYDLSIFEDEDYFIYDPDTILGDCFLCKKINIFGLKLKIPLIRAVKFVYSAKHNCYATSGRKGENGV